MYSVGIFDEEMCINSLEAKENSLFQKAWKIEPDNKERPLTVPISHLKPYTLYEK